MSNFTIHETQSYYIHLLERVRNAKSNINITSFDLIYDQKTKPLLDEVILAAKRGVSVTLSADTMTFNEIRKKYFGPIDTKHSSSLPMRNFIDKLEEAGGKFIWLSKTDLINPYKGRNHEKWSIVDEDIFCFGGINLYKSGFNANDFMFHTNNPKLARQLKTEHQKIITNYEKFEGAYYVINDKSEFFIDSGKVNSSTIYNHACKLAKIAKAVTYVSQYYPTGKLGRYLKHTKTTYYVNRPSNAKGLPKLMLIFDMLRCRIKNSYHKKRYLHAKFIIFTMHDGSEVAITGSHNFSYAGVRYGTIEIAMKTSDTSIVSQLKSFVYKISN